MEKNAEIVVRELVKNALGFPTGLLSKLTSVKPTANTAQALGLPQHLLSIVKRRRDIATRKAQRYGG